LRTNYASPGNGDSWIAFYISLRVKQYPREVPARYPFWGKGGEEGRGMIDPGTEIGHVHLKVSDLDRAVRFYRDVLGFDLMSQVPGAAFLSAGGYHHHIGLNTWDSRGGSPPPRGTTGLFHFAIRYPTRRALADALRRLAEHGVRLEGASDHGVSEALYLHDPDQNGIELYWDRPKEEWPRQEDGSIRMVTEPLDLEGLMAELK